MPERPLLPLTGGCPRGAVRYEIAAFPLLVYACHCTDCQRESGGALALNMPVATEAFHITRGAPKAWRPMRPSGERTFSWFCGDCGGRIYGERGSRPARRNVRGGTLGDTSWLVPAAHFFTRSTQRWERFGGDMLCFETLSDDFGVLARRWREMWGET